MKLEGKNYRNDFKIESRDGKFHFKVFLRKNADFAENFSIVLMYLSIEGESITLCRFNGSHGGWESSPFYWTTHIHFARQENIEKGLSPEKYVEKTTLYSAFEDALVQFMSYCNIIGWKEYLPRYNQIPMDFDGDNNK